MGNLSPELMGCVAFLDIMGFSARINSGNLPELFEKYSKILSSAVQTDPPVGFAAFSDSIVLHTLEDSEASLVSMIKAVSHLFLEFTKQGIPVRGAIAHGKFLRRGDGNNVIIAGRPIVEAFHNEGKQNWIGVMLCGSVIEKHSILLEAAHTEKPHALDRANANPRQRHLVALSFRVRVAPIPWHGSSDPLQGLAVLPMSSEELPVAPEEFKTWAASRLSEDFFSCERALHNLKWIAPDPGAQAKYTSTLAWLKVQATWITKAKLLL